MNDCNGQKPYKYLSFFCFQKRKGCLDKFEDNSTEFLLVIGGLCLALTLIEVRLTIKQSCSTALNANKEKKWRRN